MLCRTTQGDIAFKPALSLSIFFPSCLGRSYSCHVNVAIKSAGLPFELGKFIILSSRFLEIALKSNLYSF